ncbi:hypothetical protein DFJ73DRAFT_922050 [Zopfochytrium polystomum]|nr:hypothetical protein DFJ73DRAFT_922050 [Zopfochytrium polystomum]
MSMSYDDDNPQERGTVALLAASQSHSHSGMTTPPSDRLLATATTTTTTATATATTAGTTATTTTAPADAPRSFHGEAGARPPLPDHQPNGVAAAFRNYAPRSSTPPRTETRGGSGGSPLMALKKKLSAGTLVDSSPASDDLSSMSIDKVGVDPQADSAATEGASPDGADDDRDEDISDACEEEEDSPSMDWSGGEDDAWDATWDQLWDDGTAPTKYNNRTAIASSARSRLLAPQRHAPTFESAIPIEAQRRLQSFYDENFASLRAATAAANYS